MHAVFMQSKVAMTCSAMNNFHLRVLLASFCVVSLYLLYITPPSLFEEMFGMYVTGLRCLV